VRWADPGSRRPRLRAVWLLVAAVWLVALGWVGAGCAGGSAPVVEPLRDRDPKVPVVILPGITGSQLRHRETGRIVWGNSRSLFAPHDGFYALARPIDPAVEDPIEASAPLLRLRVLGLVSIDVYGSLVRVLEEHRYVVGDVSAPRAEDTLYVFPYDWRYGNVEAASVLAGFLERVRRARGEAVLHIHLVCQSNAARIGRYFVKYGAEPLEVAESGSAGPPETVRVAKLILVGTANGGSLRALKELDRGRRYVPGVGRTNLPETAFTFTSLYEALPIYRDDLFFDDTGAPVEVDLYDADSWRRYGWSIYRDDVRRRLERGGGPRGFGSPEQRHDFLARALRDARRLQLLLGADSAGFRGPSYYLLQNAGVPTDERAMLVEKDGEWRTVFSWEKPVKKDPDLSDLALAPGDGHATLESQLWLSPQEQGAMARPPVDIDERHRQMIVHPSAKRWILEFLEE
jgi:hypothetical protein